MLTQERLKELLHYDEGTGIFTWKVQTGRVRKGSVAGTPHGKGYVKIGIKGKYYRAHRLAWLWMTGEWPVNQIDHRDTVTSNNRWDNLRDVTGVVNKQNMKKPRVDGSSGYLGVSANSGKWQARIKINKKEKFLGMFATPKEAHAAYVAAKREVHEGCTI